MILTIARVQHRLTIWTYMVIGLFGLWLVGPVSAVCVKPMSGFRSWSVAEKNMLVRPHITETSPRADVSI